MAPVFGDLASNSVYWGSGLVASSSVYFGALASFDVWLQFLEFLRPGHFPLLRMSCRPGIIVVHAPGGGKEWDRTIELAAQTSSKTIYPPSQYFGAQLHLLIYGSSFLEV